MLINSKFANLLARGGVYLESTDGEGNDLGGGAEQTAEQKAEAERLRADKSTQEADEADALKKKTEGGDRKPSDEEAKLLKEVMKRKDSERALQQRLDEQAAALKQFEGIDPEAVRKLLGEQKDKETKALEEKGEWDRLKTRMGEEHSSETKALNDKIAALTAALTEKDSAINEMTVGSSFTGSEFINKELTLTPSKARVIYGQHFDLEDGKVVGYDKPKGSANRTALVDSMGNPVPFDAALRKIVEVDPDSAHLLRAGVKPGAQSNSKPGRVKDEPVEKSGFDKIAAGLGALKAF